MGQATMNARGPIVNVWHAGTKNIPGSSGAKMRSSSHSSNRSALDGKILRRRVIQTTVGEERRGDYILPCENSAKITSESHKIPEGGSRSFLMGELYLSPIYK